MSHSLNNFALREGKFCDNSPKFIKFPHMKKFSKFYLLKTQIFFDIYPNVCQQKLQNFKNFPSGNLAVTIFGVSGCCPHSLPFKSWCCPCLAQETFWTIKYMTSWDLEWLVTTRKHQFSFDAIQILATTKPSCTHMQTIGKKHSMTGAEVTYTDYYDLSFLFQVPCQKLYN